MLNEYKKKLLCIYNRPVSERDYRYAQNAYEQTLSMIRDKKSLLSRMTPAQQTKVLYT